MNPQGQLNTLTETAEMDPAKVAEKRALNRKGKFDFVIACANNNLNDLDFVIKANGFGNTFSIAHLPKLFHKFLGEIIDLNTDFTLKNANLIASISNVITSFLINAIEGNHMDPRGIVELITKNLKAREGLDDDYFVKIGLQAEFTIEKQSDIEDLQEQMESMFAYYGDNLTPQISELMLTLNQSFNDEILVQMRMNYSDSPERYFQLAQEALSRISKFLNEFMRFMRFLSEMPEEDDSEIVKGLISRVNIGAFWYHEKNIIVGSESRELANFNADKEIRSIFDDFKNKSHANEEEVGLIDKVYSEIIHEYLEVQFTSQTYYIHPGRFWMFINQVVKNLNDRLNSYNPKTESLKKFLERLNINEFNPDKKEA